MTPCSILLAAVCAFQPGSHTEIRLTQTYQDTPAGLIVHFPAGWTLDRKAPGFAIVNFPLDRRPPQVEVPINCAEIGVFTPPQGEKSIAEWMRKERINEEQGDRISRMKLSTQRLGMLDATVTRREPPVIPEGTLLIYFFEIEGRPIKASLVYRGRRNATRFENMFTAMIQNLEPTSAR